MQDGARKIAGIIWIAMVLFQCSCIYAQDLEKLKDQKPFEVKGSVSIATQFYDAHGKNSSHEPFSWILSGDPVVSVYGIMLPFSFMITDQQRDFRQPLNRFGVSPYYKWIKLHLGCRSLNFSQFSLAGHSITGAGAELTPGNFRVAFITGRLLKAVEQQSDFENNSYQTPAFKRTGTAIKIGYGTKDNFADLIFLKARDRLNSLDSVPEVNNILPSENMVAAFVTGQKLFDRVFFELEYAQSYYTSDIRSDEKDTSGGILLVPFAGLYTKRTSTAFGSALETTLGYQQGNYGLKFRYKRVEPDFRSLGAYFFLSDLENITIEPKASFFKNKLIINGSMGFQRDNVSRTKNYTTKRNIGSINITSQPIKNYSLSAQYSNYGIGQKSGLSPLDTMIEISQATRNIGVSQSYMLQKPSYLHNFIMNYSLQNLSDNNVNTSNFSEYTSHTFIAGYSLYFVDIKINAGLNYTFVQFNNELQKNAYNGPSFQLGKLFLKNKLNVSLTDAIMFNKINNEKESVINTFSLRSSYKITKKQRITLRFSLNKKDARISTSKSFTETKGEIKYVYNF